MLRAVGLGKRARRHHILRDVSIEIAEGSTAALLGPSGSGKTTLLRLIMGLERLDEGALYIGTRVLAQAGHAHTLTEHRGMAMVFQEFPLLPHLNVAQNIAFGIKRPASAKQQIDDLIDLLELGHVRRRQIDNLSGGEQQRVAIARSLAIKPEILLLDEPFSNVDPGLRERLQRRLNNRLKDLGTTTLLATHDQKEAFLLSDQLYLLRHGQVVDQGSPQQLYREPQDPWVANFFGDANLLKGREWAATGLMEGLLAAQTYMLRPEDLDIVESDGRWPTGIVQSVEFVGSFQDLDVRMDTGVVLRVRKVGYDSESMENGTRIGILVRAGVQPHPLVGTSQTTSHHDHENP